MMDSRSGSRPERAPFRRPDPDLGAELNATLHARHDLGPEYEPALVEGFIERLDRAIDARVEAQLDVRSRRRTPQKRDGMDGARLALAIISLGVSIPLTAMALAAAHSLVAAIVVWAGIVVVNMAYAIRR